MNIDARCYKWNDKGRLIGIAWIEDKLKGRISFSKFSMFGNFGNIYEPADRTGCKRE